MIEDRLLKKMNLLDKYILKIQIYNQQNERSDEIYQMAKERLLQITIECVLDICTLLIKHMKLGPPKDEEQILNILEPSLKSIQNVKEMKKFRNRLVHRYDELDEEIINQIMTSDTKDFKIFLNEVKAFLKDNFDI